MTYFNFFVLLNKVSSLSSTVQILKVLENSGDICSATVPCLTIQPMFPNGWNPGVNVELIYLQQNPIAF